MENQDHKQQYKLWSGEEQKMYQMGDFNLSMQSDGDIMFALKNGGMLFYDGKNHLLRSSGVEDMEGNMIFLSDILEHKWINGDTGKEETSYFPVIFRNGMFCTDQSFSKNESHLEPLCEDAYQCKVVGNMFENYDLLKSSK